MLFESHPGGLKYNIDGIDPGSAGFAKFLYSTMSDQPMMQSTARKSMEYMSQ